MQRIRHQKILHQILFQYFKIQFQIPLNQHLTCFALFIPFLVPNSLRSFSVSDPQFFLWFKSQVYFRRIVGSYQRTQSMSTCLTSKEPNASLQTQSRRIPFNRASMKVKRINGYEKPNKTLYLRTSNNVRVFKPLAP